jgi:hypothetical protein
MIWFVVATIAISFRRSIKLKARDIELLHAAATVEYARDHPPKAAEEKGPPPKKKSATKPTGAAPTMADALASALGEAPPPAPNGSSTAVGDGGDGDDSGDGDGAAAGDGGGAGAAATVGDVEDMPASVIVKPLNVVDVGMVQSTPDANVAPLPAAPQESSPSGGEEMAEGEVLARKETVWRSNGSRVADAANVLAGPGGAKLIGVVEM